MDALATGIGWTVIIGAIIYGIGKWLEHLEHERQKPLIIWDHERRLAFRKIYRGTEEAAIHQAVKMADGGWSLCSFDLSDSDYHQRMASSPGATEYLLAVENVKNLGDAYTLEGTKLVVRKARVA